MSNLVPIEQHQAFGRSAKAMRLLARGFATFDMPHEFTPPTDAPVLFAGNHRSFFDIVAAFAVFDALGLSSHVLVRADVFAKPVAGQWLRAVGCVPTSSQTRVTSEGQAVSLLKRGHGVAIMPEGRLVPPSDRPGGVGRGRPGVTRIARAAGARIVPVALHGTDRVWPRGTALPRPRIKRPRVTIRIGDAIEIDDRDDLAVTAEVMATLATMLAEIERTSPSR